jgi:hypothetical protein
MRKIITHFFVFSSLISCQLFAQANFNSNTAAGNWSLNTSWTLVSGTDADGVPDANDNVTILTGHQVNININAACNNLIQNGTGLINFNTNSCTLAVGGNYTLNGSDGTSGGGATRVMTVAGNLIVSATATAADIIGIDFTVSGTSAIDGAFIIAGVNGVKTFTGDVTIGSSGSFTISVVETVTMSSNLTINSTTAALTYSAAGTINLAGNFNNTGTVNFNAVGATLAVTGTLTTNSGSVITGTATGILTVGGTATVSAGGTSTWGRGTFTITGTTTVNGTLLFNNATGAKTFTGNVTFNGGSALTYNASPTLTLSNNLIINGAVTISGTTTGVMNVNGTMTVSAGATLTYSDQTISVTGLTSINGTIAFTNNQGGKTFSSVTIAATGNWNCGAADEAFSFSGTLTNNGTFTASATSAAASNYSFTGTTSSIVGTYTIPNLSVTGGAAVLTNNGTLNITNNLSGSGTFVQAANMVLNYSSTVNNISTALTFTATATGNTVNYNGAGAQTIRGVTYHHLRVTTSGTKLMGGDIIINGNLTVENTAVLDADVTNNRRITLLGNWTITSTNSDPFLEQQGRVTFAATSGTQTISNPLVAGETFYDVYFQSSSVTNPAYSTSVNINTSAITYATGVLQMNNNDLALTMSGVNSTFTAGSILTTGNNTAFTVTDASVLRRVDFDGTQFGDATFGFTTNVTANDIYFDGSDFYGTENFTKTGTGINDCAGGCVFNGTCSFTTIPGGDRWRMGHVNPDIFYNASFIHDGIGNFIIGRQTNGNEFYGTTTITSTTAGGFFITRNNGTAGASATFYGPLIINVSLSGNVNFSEGGSAFNYNVTFDNTIQCNSTATSTGDIRFGNGALGTITLTTNAQFIAGSVLGQTLILMRNVTQNGTNTQTITTTGANSYVDISSATLPCTFAGPFTVTTKRLISTSATYNNNCSFIISDTMQVRNNTFAGLTNTINFSGTVNSIGNGGNTFTNSSGNTTITNSNTAILSFGQFATDNFDGNVTFVQTGTGALQPANNATTPSTFARNVSTTGSTATITFARARFDGSTTQTLSGPAAFPPAFTNVQISNTNTGTGISVTVNNVNFTTGTVTMTSGTINLNGNTLSIGTATATAGTLTYTAGYFFNGTLRRWFAAASMTIASARGHFPMGTSNNHYRPVWLAYTANLSNGGTISVTHNPTYPAWYNGITAYNDASWGNTVIAVSNSNWTIATGNSLAFNGSTAQLRFGGQGFDAFVLTDINASLLTSTVGTFSASTSVNTPLEVNRTGLSSANVNNTWTIGTRNIVASPLPISLLSFNAVPQGDIVNVTWSTATETNNDFFTVERSADGINFSALTKVDGAGNSNQILNYNVNDELPLSGTSYYRLKQTDFDGNFTYSQIVAVNFNVSANLLVIFPNPVSDDLIFVNNIDANDVLIVTIYDASGKEILAETNFAAKPYLNIASCSEGFYLVKLVLVNGKVLNGKFVKN